MSLKINRIDLLGKIGVLTILFLIGIINQGYSTHNRAGEITYVQIDDLTIRATIVTYTRTSSFAADRDSLTLFWGDGDSTVVLRSNGNGFELPNDIKRNEYVSEHTYPTRGTYTMSVEDPNRIAGILNIDFPNSVNIRFYIETTFTLLEPRFQGQNNSIVLLQPPIDLACVGEVYTYNPNAYDMDGDSLSYELVTPRANVLNEVPNYQLPDEIVPGPENTIELNPETGDFTWNAPQVQGEYNITYRINEYREGVLINSLLRDMQILVRACTDDNNAPILASIDQVCVIAGSEIIIDIEASDIDSGEILTITASGGPFELENNPASLTTGLAIDNSMLSGVITWMTSCDDISEEFYQVVIRVTDEKSRDMTALATLKTIRIKVVGPPPGPPDAINENNVVDLSWESPYSCESSELFQGFSVWRRIGSSTVNLDTCQGGLEGQGYEKIIFLTNERDGPFYIARDAELEPGKVYCYRIVAEFGQLTDDGNIFNRTQSLPSDEICIRSSGDEPLITKVSVLNTSPDEGSILLEWINPESEVIDTTIISGPYRLVIEGSDNLFGQNLALLENYNYESFQSITDTALTISNLNTESTGHAYKVSFSSGTGGNIFESNSEVASSVFLSTEGADESVNLNWDEQVPWNNHLYYVYKSDESGDLILIDSTDQNTYIVTDLVNGTESCYRIESVGSYGIKNIKSPLLNWSNQSCAISMDESAPCRPGFDVLSLCETNTILPMQQLVNRVVWSFGSTDCQADEDLNGIQIYYAADELESMERLAFISGGEGSFDHLLDQNIAGCYAISAIDSSGNESALSEKICKDNCPSYMLPNTFSPNGDNANDLFLPRQNLFIDRVEFEVFNRWGQKVFETEDPSINWDGTNLSNKELSEGTYFYICRVFERRVSGIEEGEPLRGTIQLIR